ncbi:hypothetical protein ACFL1U_00985 [Patescibacteria group bacterium]
MKRITAFLFVLLIALCAGSFTVTVVQADEIKPRADNSHTEFIDLRYIEEGYKEGDLDQMGRVDLDALYVSLSNTSNGYDYQEVRAGYIKGFGNWGLGLSGRYTNPEDSDFQEAQIGFMVTYLKRFETGWFQFITDNYVGVDGGSGFQHSENLLLFGKWFGLEENAVRFGINGQAYYILDPNNEGEFPGGNWESESVTTGGRLEGLVNFNQALWDALVYCEYVNVQTDGESTMDTGEVYPFDETQTYFRYGLGFRYWWYGKRNATWFKVTAGPETVTDKGPLGDSSGIHAELGIGVIWGGK